MRFDPFSWKEVTPNVEIEVGKGRLRVRCSAPAPLYVSAQGCEALAGVDTAFDVEVSQAVTLRVDAPDGVRVFVYDPPGSSMVSAGVTFTNIDRMPDQHSPMNEVRRAMRELEMMRRDVMRDIRTGAAIAKAASKPKPAEPPPADPEKTAKAEKAKPEVAE